MFLGPKIIFEVFFSSCSEFEGLSPSIFCFDDFFSFDLENDLGRLKNRPSFAHGYRSRLTTKLFFLSSCVFLGPKWSVPYFRVIEYVSIVAMWGQYGNLLTNWDFFVFGNYREKIWSQVHLHGVKWPSTTEKIPNRTSIVYRRTIWVFPSGTKKW